MGDIEKRFDAIVSDFNAALSILEDMLQLIETTKSAPALRVVMLNSAIVALTSTIEETLRGLFKEYLSILEENIIDYRKLREKLQKTNLDCAINKMIKLKSDCDFKAVAVLVSGLEKCLNGQSGYQLLKENITYNKANFKSKQVTETSSNVGIGNLWESIADCAEIENYTGQTLLASRVNDLIAKWNELFDERDLVVHRISQATGWGADKIKQSIELSKLVLQRISKCLATDVNNLIDQYRHEAAKT